ncbi:MAG TPA: hypothetical protein VD867_10810 [Burkholderiales bacterium]|nr:hypothetical protein [Burkholderiales bacterium]
MPWPVAVVLAAALCTQIAWQAASLPPRASAAALGAPPPPAILRIAALGDPIALGAAFALYLQAFDNQPGISIPYRELDYARVVAWLETALALDPKGQYPLMMAAHLYGQVSDETRQRLMLDFVHRKFLEDPNRRWRWLAHAALVAKHTLRDGPLALRYADDIARYAGSAQGWARQMRIFILEDMGEREAATVLLGGLLASGEVTDAAEARFLAERLEKLRNVEKSSGPSGFR